jgi:hypothetical protein
MCGNSAVRQSTGITQANSNNNNPLLTGQTCAHELVINPIHGTLISITFAIWK